MDAWMPFEIESKIEKYMYFNRFLRFKEPGPFKWTQKTLAIVSEFYSVRLIQISTPPPFLALQYL
jgi:hypothetical protein